MITLTSSYFRFDIRTIFVKRMLNSSCFTTDYIKVSLTSWRYLLKILNPVTNERKKKIKTNWRIIFLRCFRRANNIGEKCAKANNYNAKIVETHLFYCNSNWRIKEAIHNLKFRDCRTEENVKNKKNLNLNITKTQPQNSRTVERVLRVFVYTDRHCWVTSIVLTINNFFCLYTYMKTFRFICIYI